MTTPLISIIIPTKNSSATLRECLVSISSQSYTNIETIVIDNYSQDTTKEIAGEFTDKVFSHGPERTSQKNLGIKESRGEYLCFVDSDMVLEKEVVEECYDLINKHADIGGICIQEKSVGNTLFAQIRDFERSFYNGTSIASARFFKKRDVIDVGGFEEDIVFFEESLLPQKIEKQLEKACKTTTKNSSILHMEGNIGIVSWIKKKYYYGKSLQQYKILVKNTGVEKTLQSQTSLFGRYAIFLKNKRFYTSPLAAGVLVLKTLEFGAGGLGYLVNKLSHAKK